ncbi:MAG: radical SAM/SPASM domain-containing protein [Candidatus Omnitrophica bacterium]|nr:radical SAM/SPASM domain-containing protein [Candidatus Omnitrophota bacterium]
MRFREKIRWAGKILFPICAWRMPEQVIFFITDKCNLACAHCFYWANLNKETNEATLEEIDRFSKSLGRFSFLTLTGGEPFLRDDIPEIIKIFNKNNSVSNVSIPTNGFFTERILRTTENILRNIRNVDLAVKISLDGLEEKHDAIRGARGAFLKAVDTYHGLVKLKKTNPYFKVGIIITYSALNQEDLPETLDYIEEKLNPDMISLSFARGNVRDPKIKEVDAVNYLKLYRRVLSFLLAKKNKQTNLYYRFYSAYKSKISEMIAQITNQNRYLFPCYAGRLLCIIDSSLNVYPCEIMGRGFGSIRAYGYDFRKLWFSRDAESLRKEIKDTRCCCTYECSLQIATFFNLKALLSLVPRMLWLNY